MLKIVSENFIHALLLFLGLFLQISRWVPLAIVSQRQDDTQEGDVDHMLTCGESVLDKFKEDIADFILNGVKEEVSE